MRFLMSKNMKIKSIKQIKNLVGKRVLLRADFNVPIKDGVIKDDYKLVKGLQTIKFLKDNGCKIIILTHLGKPKPGKIDKKYSVKPLANRLSVLLNEKIEYVDDCAGLKAGTKVSKLTNGQILILENIRFEKGELKNGNQLAKNLSKLADIYVNDAFAESHRDYTSMSAIKKYMPSYAGLLLEQEVISLSKALTPKKPLVVVLGGAKIGTKIKLIKNLQIKASNILIGGALANNFFMARGLEIGASLFDKESVNFAKKFSNTKVILPVDVVVMEKGSKNAVIKFANKVGETDAIYDIGPDTIRLFSSLIKKANTIFWNGPLGRFEDQSFKHGTIAIASVIASRSHGQAYGVVGGGETVEALKMTKMLDYVDWVSTGGGAMLAYLGGEKMPGLKSLVN
jgi:3-phosphoglycerate kinase